MDPIATLESVPTPAVVIDAAAVRRNLGRLARYAAAHGLAVRPHTKTHKSAVIGGMQLAAGSRGLTVAKAGEAEAMRVAFPADATADILMAYPSVDGPRADRIAAVARDSKVRVAVDSSLGVRTLAEAAARHGTSLGVLIDLDVGMGRTGVADAAAATVLAAEVCRSRALALEGIICYPGHVWDPPNRQQEPLAAVAARLEEAIDAFDRAGLCRGTVSGGSTPTLFRSHLVPEGTECRAGTCVYNDLNIVRGGFGALDDCAARIVATVVSDAVDGQVILDAGSKTLTMDRCGPAPDSGHGLIVEYPEAFVGRLTEEHAQVDVSRLARPPRVGERVTVIPNHVCPAVNLQSHVWWHEADGSLQALPVDARGLLS